MSSQDNNSAPAEGIAEESQPVNGMVVVGGEGGETGGEAGGADAVPRLVDCGISTELNMVALGFLIRGLSFFSSGSYVDALSMLRLSYELLNAPAVSQVIRDQFEDLCSKYTLNDTPPFFTNLTSLSSNDTVKPMLEKAAIIFVAASARARITLNLEKVADSRDTIAVVEKALEVLSSPDVADIDLNDFKLKMLLDIDILSTELLIMSASYEDAASQLEKCEALCLEHDSLHDSIVGLTSLRALLTSRLGQYSKSIDLWRIVATERKRAFEREHRHPFSFSAHHDDVLARCQFETIYVHYLKADFASALPMCEEYIANCQAVYCKNHFFLLRLQTLLGWIHIRIYEVTAAFKIFMEIMATLESKTVPSLIGKESGLLASCMCGKIECLLEMAKYDETKILLTTASLIRKNLYGSSSHPMSLEVTDLTIRAILVRGRTYASAEPLIEQFLTRAEAAVGENHPLYATALMRKAWLLKDTGVTDKAIDTLDSAVVIMRNCFGEDSLWCIQANEMMVELLISKKSYDEASRELKQVMAAKSAFFKTISYCKSGDASKASETAITNPEMLSFNLLYADLEIAKRTAQLELTVKSLTEIASIYKHCSYLGKRHPRTYAALALAFYAVYVLGTSVKQCHRGYLKMKKAIEKVAEKGFSEEHPWMKRFFVQEIEYPPDLPIANAEDQRSDSEEEDDDDEDEEPITPVDVKGTGSGEVDGVDDGGAKRVDEDNYEVSVSKFLFAQGKQMMSIVDYNSAKVLFQQCFAHRQALYGYNEVAIFALLNVGEAEYMQGNYLASEEIYRKCNELFCACSGSWSLQVAELKLKLSSTLRALGSIKASADMLQGCIAIRRELLPAINKDTARALHEYGVLKAELFMLDDALSMIMRAMSMRKRLFGKYHLDVAESHVGKALVYEWQGKYKEAIAEVSRAITIRERVCIESKTPRTAELLALKARILLRQCIDLSGALNLIDTALETLKVLLGADHPCYWSAQLIKADILRIMANFVDSRAIYDEILAKRVELFNEVHISLGDIFYGIAEICRETAQYNQCRDFNRKAIQVFRKEYTDVHPKILSCEFSVAESHRAVGDLIEAIPKHEAIRKNRQMLLGKSHPETIRCDQVDLDIQLRMKSDKAELENSATLMLQFERKLLGEDSIDVAAALNTRGEILRSSARFSEAMVNFDEAINIYRRVLGERHPRTIEVINNRCLCSTTLRVRNSALERQKHLLMKAKSSQVSHLETSTDATHGGDEAAAKSDMTPITEAGPSDAFGGSLTETSENPFPVTEASVSEVKLTANKPAQKIPVFDRTDFNGARDEILTCIKALERLYPQDSKYGAENSPTHPMVANLRGNIGIIDKLETEAKAQFAEKLSREERRLFLAAEQALQVKEIENNDDEVIYEPGQKAIYLATVYFEKFPYELSHNWRVKFTEQLDAAPTLQDDATSIAEQLLLSADDKFKAGHITNAYRDYESAHAILDGDSRKAQLLHADSIVGMGRCVLYLCKYDDALSLFTKAISVRRKFVPEGNDILNECQYEVAMILNTLGQHMDALNMVDEMYSLTVKNKGEKDLLSIKLKIAMATIHLSNSNFNKALKICDELLRKCPANFDHELAKIYLIKGRVLIRLSKFSDAYAAVDKGQAIRRELYGKVDHLDLAECFQLKAELLLSYKGDSMNGFRLGSLALAMRKRCVRNSVKFIIEKPTSASEDFMAGKKAEESDPNAEGGSVANQGEAGSTSTDVKAAESAASATVTESAYPNPDPEGPTTNTGDEDEEGNTEELPTEAQVKDPIAKAAEDEKKEQELLLADGVDPADLLNTAILESLAFKARCLDGLGKYNDAILVHNDALHMAEEIFGLQHDAVARALLYRAENRRVLRNYKAAHEDYERAADIYLQRNGAESVNYNEVLVCKAGNLIQQSKFQEALSLLEAAQPVILAELGDMHFISANLNFSMGQVLTHMGPITASIDTFEKNLAQRKRIFGGTDKNRHPDVAMSYCGFGDALLLYGKYSRAVTQYEKASMIMTEKFGDSHPVLAMIWHNMGRAYRMLGDFDAAKHNLENGLIVRRDLFGKNHHETADSILGIAFNLHDQGMYKAAIPYFTKALDIFRDKIPTQIYDNSPFHSLIADAYYGCAENSKALGDFDAALDHYNKAIKVRVMLYGESHLFTQLIYGSLADLYLAMGRIHDAERLNLETQDNLKPMLNEGDKRIAKQLLTNARILEAQGAYAAAKTLYDRAYNLYTHVFGTDHPESARPLYFMAELARKMGRFDVSKAQHGECMRIKLEVFAGPQADIALSYTGMGFTHLAMGVVDKAYILFLKAILLNKSELPSRHLQQSMALKGLGECLRLYGKVSTTISVTEQYEAVFKHDNNAAIKPVFVEVPPEVMALEKKIDFPLNAFDVLTMSLRNLSETYDKNNMYTADVSIGLARCLKDMGRYSDASNLCRDILKMQRRCVGDSHPALVETLIEQTSILIEWGRLFPVTEQFKVNQEYANHAATLLRQTMSLDASSGWSISMLKAAFPNKGGFKWKHAADKVKKKQHRRGYMGYEYPDEVVLERTNVFDDNLYDAENEVSAIDAIQQSKSTKGSKHSGNAQKVVEYAADPLTGDAERLIEVALQFQYKFYPVQGDHPWTVNLLILKAELLRRRADRTLTTKILQQAQGMMRRFLNPGHPDFATLLVAMGNNSRDNLNVKFALQCYEEAMVIRSAHFGADHLSIAECQLGIASVMASEGNIAGARDLISIALATRVKWLPKSHPLVASASQALAMSYLANNEWLEEARKMLKYAVEVKVECFGPSHFEVCTCFNDYALVCKAMGLYSEAVSILQHTSKAQRKMYGDYNLDVAITVHNQASVYLDMGNYAEAEPLFLESLKIKRELFGFDHSIVGDELNNIGGLYQMMNKLDAAQKFYLDALHVRVRSNGEINLGVAEVLNNLGILAFARQKLDSAQDYLEKALVVKRKVCGPQDAGLASTLHNLACVYHCMVAEEEARTLYEECLEIRKVALGPNHPDTIACMSNLDRLRCSILQDQMKNTSQSIAYLDSDAHGPEEETTELPQNPEHES